MSNDLEALAIRYRVAFPEPHTHLYHVTARVPLFGGYEQVDLALPAWTPGSYRVRDFARHVQDVESAAPHRKVDKQTWRFETRGLAELEVRYRVYANEMTVRTAHLDDRHAYWNGANLFLYFAGEKDRPALVEVEGVPEGWTVATGLEPVPGRERAYRASSYDELVDSPVDVGAFATATFEVEGVPHRIVIDGDGNYDIDRVRQDVERIVRSELAMFGGAPPYPHYTFLVILTPEGVPGGGLEHARSTTVMTQRWRFRPRERYDDFLALVSHEFFHLWNVKRLRPRELGPFDYGQENYSRALWIVEGVTSYYDELFLRRAAIWDADAYLKKTAEHIASLEETPGRRHQSLEEAGFDAWIKFYQRNEHSVNATVSYYEKGQIVAWLLDLEIRARSGGARSLDDVLRALWREHPESGPGYDIPRFEELATEAAGADLAPFFAGYVRGTADLDYDRHLAPFGLRLAWEPKGKERDGPRPDEPEVRARLGVRTRAVEGGRAVVSEVLEGGPAWAAGLQASDEVLAIDGLRVSHESLEARIHERRPGDRVEAAVFRGDRLVRVPVVLDGAPWARAAIRRRPDATDEQRRLYEGWLGEPWRPPGA